MKNHQISALVKKREEIIQKPPTQRKRNRKAVSKSSHEWYIEISSVYLIAKGETMKTTVGLWMTIEGY